MAAKMLFAVAAALCAFAAVTAGPARLFQDAELGLQHLDKLDFLDQPSVQNLDSNKFFWINATEILEKIEQSLERLQDKIELVSEEVQSAVQAIVDGIESAATAAAEQWSNDVADWVARANKTNVDVQECLQAELVPLADVSAALKADAHQCIAGRMDDLIDTLADVKSAGPAAKELLAEAIAKVQKCNSVDNVVQTTVCLIEQLPGVQVKAAALVARATVSASIAAAQAAAIIPMASLCTSASAARYATQVSAIADTTVACIKSKIGA